MREPLQLGGRGRTIHTADGRVVAFAPDDDLPGFAGWVGLRNTLVAAPELANLLDRVEAAVHSGDLHGLKQLFKTARVKDLLARTRKEA